MNKWTKDCNHQEMITLLKNKYILVFCIINITSCSSVNITTPDRSKNITMNSKLKSFDSSKFSILSEFKEVTKLEEFSNHVEQMLLKYDYEDFLPKNFNIQSVNSFINAMGTLGYFSGLQTSAKTNINFLGTNGTELILTNTPMFVTSSNVWDQNTEEYTPMFVEETKQIVQPRMNEYGWKCELTDEIISANKTVEEVKNPTEISSIFKSTNGNYMFTWFNKFCAAFSVGTFKNETVSFSKILLNILMRYYGFYAYGGGYNETYGGNTLNYDSVIQNGTFFRYSLNANNPTILFYACTMGDLMVQGKPADVTLIPIRSEDISSRIENNDWISVNVEQPFIYYNTLFRRTVGGTNTNDHQTFSDITYVPGPVTAICFVIVDQDNPDNDDDILIGANGVVNTSTNNPWDGVNVGVTCNDILNNSNILGDQVYTRWCRYFYNPMDVEIAMDVMSRVGFKFPLMKRSGYVYDGTSSQSMDTGFELLDIDSGAMSGWSHITDYNVLNSTISLDFSRSSRCFSDSLGTRVGGVADAVIYNIPDCSEMMYLAGARHILKDVGCGKYLSETISHIYYRSLIWSLKTAFIFDFYRSLTHKPLNSEIIQPLSSGITLQDYKTIGFETAKIIDNAIMTKCNTKNYVSKGNLANLASGLTYNDTFMAGQINRNLMETGSFTNYSMYYKLWNWIVTTFKIENVIIKGKPMINMSRRPNTNVITMKMIVDETNNAIYQDNDENENFELMNGIQQMMLDTQDRIRHTDNNGNLQHHATGLSGIYLFATPDGQQYRLWRHKQSFHRTTNNTGEVVWSRLEFNYTYFNNICNGVDCLYVIDINNNGKAYENINMNSEKKDKDSKLGFGKKPLDVKSN